MIKMEYSIYALSTITQASANEIYANSTPNLEPVPVV
jgi:hypothetical protein